MKMRYSKPKNYGYQYIGRYDDASIYMVTEQDNAKSQQELESEMRLQRLQVTLRSYKLCKLAWGMEDILYKIDQKPIWTQSKR